jgi:diadenosine tetraphosphate (Ap4A) HIT family hydrolase
MADSQDGGAVSLDTEIHRRVAALRAGQDPTVVARVRSGWLVMGSPQVIPGYCLLLPDPVVPDLNALTATARSVFLEEMASMGDVLMSVMGAVRINYAIFGNVEPALHAHLFPRHHEEPAELRLAQPWAWDWQAAPAFQLALHETLLRRLRSAVIDTLPGAFFPA